MLHKCQWAVHGTAQCPPPPKMVLPEHSHDYDGHTQAVTKYDTQNYLLIDFIVYLLVYNDIKCYHPNHP